jgi:hypothetical protein
VILAIGVRDGAADQQLVPVQVLSLHGAGAEEVLGKLWDKSFEQGRLAALDELQDRLCVCMK